ncbi:MAG: bifunctional phosphoribosylaminoimidazolecarboxamide formyltransferase/IMP cyclohydrolase [Deltaproteobacteria bacterium]|nr:bifunctional phosphoribosylaminoimidazolecarboxamide formyltransferase/IMP cyclohydrolase [Deltaproteobacteria bacterium]
MSETRLALISVYDKTGLENFARSLIQLHFQIISTGKTAAFLKDCGISVQGVSDYTGFPEILGGRVKTLHPKIHAGILARKNETEDQKILRDLDIPFIDLVVVNLYPFESAPGIENIDVGGPTMLRAAAKNFENVTVVTDTGDYNRVLKAFENGKPSLELRKELAGKVFARTAKYDAAIANCPGLWTMDQGPKTGVSQLRYGENPHQKALWRVSPNEALWEAPLQGKELSYNNIVDADAAWWIIWEFQKSKIKNQNFVCAIIKHTNPCGVALSEKSLKIAFEKALSCDPTSAFGGIVACNKPIDADTAVSLTGIFLEVILAPDFSKEALEIFSHKKNLRLLKTRFDVVPQQTMRSAGGGELTQTADIIAEESSKWEIKTKRAPTEKEMQALQFAWKVVKHVKSNAIVFGFEDRIAAIGAGQTSRVDSVKVAIMKAKESLKGTVVASDAFFPFPDNIEEIAKTGATAVIQPGGSIKDAEVIASADKHNLAMVFTGIRHFRH